MNILFFLIQIVLILLFTYGALKLGKGALITAVTVQALLANLFVLKQMDLFGLEVTCSDAFAVGSILGLNLVREYFGKEDAKKAISICFFFLSFFVAMSYLHLQFIPSLHDTTQVAYLKLLKPAPRILFASLIVFFIVQHLDVRLFGWLSKILPKTSFPVRSALSLTCSQGVDTVLFSFLGLYGIVAHIGHIILLSFFIKVCVIATLSPMTALFKRVQKHV